MPEKGAKWVELRKCPKNLHNFDEFNLLSLPVQNCLKKMIAENPSTRLTIKQVINEIDDTRNKETLWMNIAERAIKESKTISPKFKGEKLWIGKCKSFND